jgi:light-regulated signal transduction histidine kinase (bacteriophytochrome)
MTDMTEPPAHERGAVAAESTTGGERRDGEIREALEHDQNQADGAIDSERRDARHIQQRTDTQRRDARDAQDRIDVKADTQRRDARDAQDRIDVKADTQRRDARDTQDQAEAAQDSERRDAQDLFDARRDGERREAFEQNVTDHQRADELEQANQNLEAFAYSVSHDLRAPLRAMKGYSAALLEEYGHSLGEAGRGYAEQIHAASQQMAQLIGALLHLARLSRAEIHLQAVDLGAQAASIAGELQRNEPDRRVRFTIQQPVWAMADPSLIRTVLQNLLENAWKFTSGRDDASIEVGTTRASDARICCYVRDNGAGYDSAYADKLFSPFQRLHTRDEFPGTGVGLASVRQIVERHGGRVRAVGTVGEGATFSFTLAGTSATA